MRVSIVLPAYNEAKRLRNAVKKVLEAAKQTGYEHEIIIAEDGSTDGTDQVAAELAKEYKEVTHLHSKDRLGRGKALINAFEKASGEIVVYMDVDLATDLSHLKELVDAIAVENYDIATGSRLLKESEADRPIKRDIASKVYNFLVRLLLGSKIKDHQCGFKAFRKNAILQICKNVKDNHWFWDTEVLVLAQKLGYKVKEIPVKWRHGGETKVRLSKDATYMFSQILRMWLEEKKSSRKYLIATTILAIALLVLLAYSAGLQNVYQSLLKLKPSLLIFSATLYCLSYIVRGYRYEYMLSILGLRSGLPLSIKAVCISQTVNVITPIRIGDLARAYVSKKADIPYSSSLGAITAERVFDLISVAVIAAISAIFLKTFSNAPVYALLFSAIIITLIVLLSRMENFVGRIFKSAKKVFSLRDSIVVGLLSLSIWFTDIAVCYIIATNYGFPSVLLISFAVALGNIVKALPITPGGIGTYELALTTVLSSSFPPETAFAIALIDHAVKNFSTFLLGLAALASLGISLREVKE